MTDQMTDRVTDQTTDQMADWLRRCLDGGRERLRAAARDSAVSVI